MDEAELNSRLSWISTIWSCWIKPRRLLKVHRRRGALSSSSLPGGRLSLSPGSRPESGYRRRVVPGVRRPASARGGLLVSAHPGRGQVPRLPEDHALPLGESITRGSYAGGSVAFRYRRWSSQPAAWHWDSDEAERLSRSWKAGAKNCWASALGLPLSGSGGGKAGNRITRVLKFRAEHPGRSQPETAG